MKNRIPFIPRCVAMLGNPRQHLICIADATNIAHLICMLMRRMLTRYAQGLRGAMQS